MIIIVKFFPISLKQSSDIVEVVEVVVVVLLQTMPRLYKPAS